MTGVISEALFAMWMVRPLLQGELREDTAVVTDLLTYRDLFWFHLPLAGTSVLILFVQPVVAFSLARLARPTDSLAAWPVLFQITLLARAPALALPEAVIALSKGPAHLSTLTALYFYPCRCDDGVDCPFYLDPRGKILYLSDTRYDG